MSCVLLYLCHHLTTAFLQNLWYCVVMWWYCWCGDTVIWWYRATVTTLLVRTDAEQCLVRTLLSSQGDRLGETRQQYCWYHHSMPASPGFLWLTEGIIGATFCFTDFPCFSWDICVLEEFDIELENSEAVKCYLSSYWYFSVFEIARQCNVSWSR